MNNQKSIYLLDNIKILLQGAKINKQLATHIQKSLRANEISKISPVYGGDINSSYKICLDDKKYFFVKTNLASKYSMFECEFEALKEIAKTSTIRAPKPLLCGVFENSSYIVMEYLELSKASNMVSKQLGYNLASMHKVVYDKFGWHLDNTIGSTKQYNTFENNWVDFFRKYRLLPQIKLAKQNGANNSLIIKADKLIDELDEFLNHNPKASLLHGDLWGGNWASVSDEPVIYDPATYYGDREVDIAMSELFGGFGSEFYKAYNEVFSLDSGYEQRKTIYNLYHIINHYNLFGGSYDIQAINMIETLE